MTYWLLKSEPDEYSWDHLVRDGRGGWDGVRNHMAANNLRAMKKGERGFFYHTGQERRIVGVLEITREHYPDPSDPAGKFVMVDVAPVAAVGRPVTLAEVKADKRFADFTLVRFSRLSVMPVSTAYWKALCAMAEIKA